ncbi:hypothetical protein FOZ60_001936 [Perkinsus olseni]|uniref:Uncharacterized protein n=1 Tax=Perkinsus olseni TaxID=32597 RepID=A0A7J6NZD1_PEROL|nr:hypothetical protein FOZ60_001936 [Perkinsus olseni]
MVFARSPAVSCEVLGEMSVFGLQTYKSFQEFSAEYESTKASLESRVAKLESDSKKIAKENVKFKARLDASAAVRGQLVETRRRLAMAVLRGIGDAVGSTKAYILREAFYSWRERLRADRLKTLENRLASLNRAIERTSAALEMKMLTVNDGIASQRDEIHEAIGLLDRRCNAALERTEDTLGKMKVEIEGPREVSSFSCYVCIGKDKRVRVENHNFMPDDGRMGAPVRLRGICSLQEAYERPSDCLTVGVELESSERPGLYMKLSKGREILRCLEVVRNRMVKSARWVIHNAREVLALGRPAVTSQRFTIAGVEQVEIEIAVSEGKKWGQPVLGVKLSCTGVISLKVGVKVGRTPQKILGASLDAAEVSKSIRKAVDLPALTIAKSNLCPLLDGGALDHSENTATVVLTVLSARLASRQLAPGVTVHEESEGEWRCEVPAFVPPTSPGGIMTCVDLPRVLLGGCLIAHRMTRVETNVCIDIQVPDRSPAEELLVSRGMARESANELENSPSEETRYSRPCHTALPRVHRYGSLLRSEGSAKSYSRSITILLPSSGWECSCKPADFPCAESS